MNSQQKTEKQTFYSVLKNQKCQLLDNILSKENGVLVRQLGAQGPHFATPRRVRPPN